MGKINPDNSAPMVETLEKYLQAMPVVVTGINRKINIGNYETIDVYHGLLMPVAEAANVSDMDELKEIIARISAEAFAANAKEVNERYNTIKKMMNNA